MYPTAPSRPCLRSYRHAIQLPCRSNGGCNKRITTLGKEACADLEQTANEIGASTHPSQRLLMLNLVEFDRDLRSLDGDLGQLGFGLGPTGW